MVSSGTVKAYKPSFTQRIVRVVQKVFQPKKPGEVGVGGYSTPITNVVPEKYVNTSTKETLAQNNRVTKLTSGYATPQSPSSRSSSAGGSSSRSSSAGGSSSRSSPAGGSSLPPSDASFTSGGQTYNPATKTSSNSVDIEKPYEWNQQTGQFENTKNRQELVIEMAGNQPKLENTETYSWLKKDSSIPNFGTSYTNPTTGVTQGAFKSYEQLYYEGQSVSKPEETNIKSVGATAGLIGASIVAPEVLLGHSVYNLGKGLKSIQDSNPSFVGGFSTVTNIGGTNPNLDVSTMNLINTPETQKYLGAGILSGLSYSSIKIPQIERSIVAGQIGANPRLDLASSKVVRGENSQLDYTEITGVSESGLKTNVKLFGFTKTTPDGTKFINYGTGQSETSGYIWNINNARGGTKYFSTSTFNYGGAGISQSTDDLVYNLGKTVIKPGYQYSTIYSNPEQFVSGKLTYGGDKITGYTIGVSKPTTPDIVGNQRFLSAGYKYSSDSVSPFLGQSTFYNYNKPSGGFTSFRGGGSNTPFTKTIQTPSIIPMLDSVSGTSTIITTPVLSPPPSGLIYAGLSLDKLDQKYIQSFTPSLVVNPTQSSKENSVMVTPNVLQQPGVNLTPRLGTTTITPPDTSSKLKNPQVTKQITPLIPQISTPGIPNLPNYTPGIIIPPFWLPDFGSSGKSVSRIYKGKQAIKYTPSYEAIIGLRKGSTTKRSGFTGLETRGFTKGFSWTNKKKSRAHPVRLFQMPQLIRRRRRKKRR
jgi:hypothetical protein